MLSGANFCVSSSRHGRLSSGGIDFVGYWSKGTALLGVRVNLLVWWLGFSFEYRRLETCALVFVMVACGRGLLRTVLRRDRKEAGTGRDLKYRAKSSHVMLVET